MNEKRVKIKNNKEKNGFCIKTTHKALSKINKICLLKSKIPSIEELAGS